ncbi:DUF58 domain-containing protein [Amorphus orientalis]|uniref:Uncharacterized protein (DUF58 family) n=1 Tax=Amorphus orientalis TaxID=649198 RepID=A0AAE4ASE5_9HYPH|nr:DUF58 domain-containing protein [Amorphus orientalis]MDQ0313889.1 uncharacterized protein (DUF58 family) [Amorphus orientalis]
MASDRSGLSAQGEGQAALASARSVAATMPDLLVEARRVAATVAMGWHGRRRAGPGETFWEFRPFETGEPAHRVDWRRSARDDALFVREQEWEAAHTVWLSVDRSPSMAFGSKLSPVTKRDRAVVLTLALADLLARGGERIGLIGGMRPTASRDAAERVADALMHLAPSSALPETEQVRRFSDVVVVGDLLDPLDEIDAWMHKLAGTGARAHLVQVLDPVEETFPFGGRAEFRDPEAGTTLLVGRAERWRGDYRRVLEAHREALADRCRRLGWTFLVHHTDRSAAEPLLALRARMAAGGKP